MSKRVLMVCAVATAICVSAAGMVRANGPRGHHMGGPPMGGGMMEGPGMILPLIMKHADLTPDQQTQVHQIMQADRQQLHDLFSQMHTANDALVNALLAPGTVDQQSLTSQMDQIAQLRQKLMEQGLKSALAIRGVLRDDQLAKVAQLKDKMQALHTQMHQLMESE
jgi:Spy/CpxP family protein refolding chaperone